MIIYFRILLFYKVLNSSVKCFNEFNRLINLISKL